MSESNTPSDGFIETPFAWLLLAIVLLFIPLAGYMWQAEMPWDAVHPAINAMLNGSSLVSLLAGRVAIKKANEHLHKQCMVAAFASSTLFLISYLTRYAISGTHHYPGHGWPKVVYLVILFSHMLLASLLVPMVLRSLYLGHKGQRSKHRKIARWTWPVWVYVSVTGVLVYLMLYRW